MRKVTKSKSVFPTQGQSFKMLYLAVSGYHEKMDWPTAGLVYLNLANCHYGQIVIKSKKIKAYRIAVSLLYSMVSHGGFEPPTP